MGQDRTAGDPDEEAQTQLHFVGSATAKTAQLGKRTATLPSSSLGNREHQRRRASGPGKGLCRGPNGNLPWSNPKSKYSLLKSSQIAQ